MSQSSGVLKKIAFALLFVLVQLVGISLYLGIDNYVNAGKILNNLSSRYEVMGEIDGDRRAVLATKMETGTLTISAINKKATTSIRWCTKGFYITLDKIPTYNNGNSVRDASSVSKFGESFLYADNDCADSTNDYSTGGYLESVYTFDSDAFFNRFSDIQDQLGNITRDVTVYLQPIFMTYTYTGEDSKGRPTGPTRTDNIYNWSQITTTESWSTETRDGFAKYYNIELVFSPGQQTIKIVNELQYANGTTQTLNMQWYTRFINESITPYKQDTIYEYEGKFFEFEKTVSTTYQKKRGQYLAADKYVDVTESQGKITVSSDAVPYGGLFIHIYLKEVDKLEENEFVRELNDATHTRIGTGGSLAKVAVGEDVSWNLTNPQYGYINRQWAECKDQSGPKIYDLVGVYVTKKSNGREVLRLDANNSYLEKIMKNKVTVAEGGMLVHFVYEGKTVNQFVREWTTGEEFDSGIFDTEAEVGETLYYSVLAKIKYENNRWKEYTLGTGEEYGDLVRVYIKNSSGNIVKDLQKGTVSMTRLCNNSVTIESGGMTVHYVYEKPTTTPTPTPTTTPTPTIPSVVIPVADSSQESFTSPSSEGKIRADDRGSEKFNVETGVATTESLYVEVKGTKYLLGYNLQKKVGKKTFPVEVKRKVTLIWKNVLGTETTTESFDYTTTVQITRAYGYWEIENLDYYTISSTNVSNYALPNGSVTISSKDSENPIPSISYSHNSAFESHVFYPVQYYNGVRLSEIFVYGDTSRPTFEASDYTAEANALVDQFKVKNDSLNFGGVDVIPNVTCDYDTGSIQKSAIYKTSELCNQNVLYKNDYIIDAVKLNGTYYSNGIIYYRRVAGVNSSMSDIISYGVNGINNVTIHTPVLCNPIVSADNEKYVQLITPTENCTQLVLDENASLNDFTLNISNYGAHNYKQGYYTRDFSYNLHGGGDASYIQKKNGDLCNEVKFPFDVYLYRADGSETYVAKNTWVIIGRSTVRFHLPMWVDEGVYTVDCRTVAVNCNDSLMEKTEYLRNTSLNNYVANNTFQVEVSGRIYGMKLYDLTDYPIWEEVFREKNSLQFKSNNTTPYESGVNKNNYSKNYIYNYTTGTNDQYGNSTDRLSKYTFPLVNGSHPYYKNVGVLKKGYALRFSLESIGNLYSDACKVIVKPSFWFVDRNGNNRTQVDLYYSEDIAGKSRKLVKVGSSLDLINLKQIRTGDVSLGIPKTELKNTALLKNTSYKKFVAQVEAMFSFSNIKLNSAFRTYVNQDYSKSILTSSDAAAITAKGITSADIDIRKQRWYGEYYIPGTAMAVKSGFDVYDYADKYGVDMSEDFWLTNGYIIVNYDIYTIDQNGNQRLSYTNASNYLNNGNCCMWVMEGYQLQKTDYEDTTFSFMIGDVILYDAEACVNDDYVVGGTH